MSTISNLTATDAPHWDTPENHGPLVNYLTWFFIISASISVLTRVLMRYAVVREIRWDDASIMFATVNSHHIQFSKDTSAHCDLFSYWG